jgi:hypothetical protein
VHTQFFVKLANKRGAGILTRFNFSTGEFPHASQSLA